jgi:hypothetical protein
MKIYFAGGAGIKNAPREEVHLRYIKYRLLSYYYIVIENDQKYSFERLIEKKNEQL